MSWLPEYLAYRIDANDIWQEKTIPHPNGHSGMWLSCPGGQIVDYSDPRTWKAVTDAEKRAVQRALGPTLLQLDQDYRRKIKELDVNLKNLRCIPDGYNAAWTEVKRKFEGDVIDELGVNNDLLKDGKLKDESLIFKLDRWYGLIGDHRYAPNWPLTQDRKDVHGRLVQNPDAFACDRCVEKQVLCYGHRERKDQQCDSCYAVRVTCSKSRRMTKVHI